MYEKNLGLTVKDRVTGFKGVIMNVTTYIHGTDRVHIQPPLDKDNKMMSGHDFDCCQLDILKNKRVIDEPKFQIKIKHGQKVSCDLTGYKGLVYAIGFHLNGCRRIGVIQNLKDSKDRKLEDVQWFDEQGLTILDKKVKVKRDTSTGGPAKAPDNRRF